MGSPVEVIPGWSQINERLDSTLVQLNRLMHYYADVTPDEMLREPDPIRKPCVSEECLDTNMQDILREAQTRLREFTETMQRLTGGPASADNGGQNLHESNEACERSLANSERQVYLLKRDLSHARKDIVNLQNKMKEYEHTIDQDQVRDSSSHDTKLARDLEKTRCELLNKTKEYEAVLLSKERAINDLNEMKKTRKEEMRGRQKEAVREKMQSQCEVRNLKEKFQREVLTATQHHLDREIELQNMCQREKDAHFKSIEDMMELHKEKIKNLKEEHAAKFEECCQNHASLEVEWHDKEVELQKKISEAVQERASYIQKVFDERVKVQALEEKLTVLQSDLANEKSNKMQVESELKFAKVDLSLMVEKLKMAQKAQEQVQLNCNSLQDEIMDLKCAHATNITKAEEKALALQKELSSITSTCVHSEHELQSNKTKFERLQRCFDIKHKDLVAATIEIQKLQQEVKFLQSDIKSKNEEMKTLQRSNEIQCHQLQTTVFKLKMEEKQKSENIISKTKEAMETELQRQKQQHKENVCKLQKQIRMQGEELNKNSSTNYRWNMEGLCRS